jgi:coenzyme F420-reducing hydrogenase gamma subunit
MIAVKTCPPTPDAVVKALHQAGIEVSPEILKTRDKTMGSYMKRYEGKPEFDESLFRID